MWYLEARVREPILFFHLKALETFSQENTRINKPKIK